MKMSDSEIATYVDMWLSMKPYINAKDRDIACEKFLSVINEGICDLTEVGDEWFGFDSTLDRVSETNIMKMHMIISKKTLMNMMIGNELV